MSGGVSTFGVGISAGTYRTDENCERIKLSKVLNDLGMKVVCVNICLDPRVFLCNGTIRTLCPFEGKIGSKPSEQWLNFNKLRPDYDIYTERLKVVEKEEEEKDSKIEKKKELKRNKEKKIRSN